MLIEKIINKLGLNQSRNSSVILLLLVAFVVQVSIPSWPDDKGDVKYYRAWCRVLVNEGLASGYWDSPTLHNSSTTIDYPPIYPYFLYGIGKMFKFVSPNSFATDNLLLDFFIKLPAISANIAISILIFAFVKQKTQYKTALLVMLAYAFNPAIILNTAYWGQTDAITSLFVLLSIICLSNKKPELAWVSITLGVFMKPLAYPFVPIVALFTLKQFGMKRTLRCALASIITTFVIFLPFIYINRISDIIYSLFFQLDAMPYISVNAHNIWWIIGAGTPWVYAGIKPFGLISYRLIGIALFGIFYVVSLLKFWKSNNENSLYYLSASVAFGFFMLSTHMHENHLFTLFPLLSMIYFYDKRLKWVYMILTFTFFVNMFIHHPFMITLKPFTIGPMLNIPYRMGGDISLLRLCMTVLNTQINILVFCYWIYYLYFKGRSFFNLDVFETGIRLNRPTLTNVAAVVILFISFTSIPFIAKAARLQNEHFLLSDLDTAEIKTIKNDYVTTSFLNINNDFRPIIFEHPPSQITYKLTLPERAFLSFGIALNPETWSADKGDGVLFELYVQDGGMPERVFSKYIDPKHNVADRKWHDEVVDLSRYGGKEVNLSFVTTPGFNYNGDFDWAGWSNPKLISANQTVSK